MPGEWQQRAGGMGTGPTTAEEMEEEESCG